MNELHRFSTAELLVAGLEWQRIVPYIQSKISAFAKILLIIISKLTSFIKNGLENVNAQRLLIQNQVL